MITLAQKFVSETEVKKSRFIATAVPVKSVDEAMSVLKDVSIKDATHNCYGYKIGDSYRFSDDGEPAGTAGRPIFSAIEGQKVDRVIVVVTRYFGGIKLGAGGLVRAYGQAASKCLKQAPKVTVFPTLKFSVKVGFESIGVVYSSLGKFNVNKFLKSDVPDGVEFIVEIKESDYGSFVRQLKDATSGSVVIGKFPFHNGMRTR
jgi:uncharacterized YigZ family protein